MISLAVYVSKQTNLSINLSNKFTAKAEQPIHWPHWLKTTDGISQILWVYFRYPPMEKAHLNHLEREGPSKNRSTFCLSHSVRTNYIFFLPIEQVGNSPKLLFGARGNA